MTGGNLSKVLSDIIVILHLKNYDDMPQNFPYKMNLMAFCILLTGHMQRVTCSKFTLT